MKMKFAWCLLILISIYNHTIAQYSNKNISTKIVKSIIKIEMELSAFGVESDNFPSILAKIDFTHGKNICVKSYDNPAHKGSSYVLSKTELDQIKQILETQNLEKMKKEYKDSRPDQPSSRITIHTSKNTFTINDYGLIGEPALQKLYKIVYKL